MLQIQRYEDNKEDKKREDLNVGGDESDKDYILNSESKVTSTAKQVLGNCKRMVFTNLMGTRLSTNTYFGHPGVIKDLTLNN